MELIIKPTEKCNFKCTFCSSTQLTDDKNKVLEIDLIDQFLTRFPETNSIIVNGGDPLMMPREYYYEILKIIEDKKMSVKLGFTTNLWGFYKNPDYWAPLFKHPLVGVTTSFNYGNTRRITKEQIYTEEYFWKISDLMLEKIGYRPSFISVITHENYSTAIDNVKLAQKMNVECKLNYALASGDQTEPFLKGHIYQSYLDIIDMGLAEWEYNSKQILAKQKSLHTTCPLNRTCDDNIRCLQPDGDYYSCGAFGDDKLYSIDFQQEMKSSQKFLPLQQDIQIQYMKEQCLTCPLFNICNGCKKTIHDVKSRNLVEAHCNLMQENLTRLVKYLN